MSDDKIQDCVERIQEEMVEFHEEHVRDREERREEEEAHMRDLAERAHAPKADTEAREQLAAAEQEEAGMQ